MNTNETECEFEPLVSEWLDGELDAADANDLREHLNGCAGCRAVSQKFGAVDDLIGLLGAVNHDIGDKNSATKEAEPFVTTSQASPSWRFSHLIPLAVAASVVIGMGVAFWPSPKPVSASTMTAEQIMRPLTELEMINRQKQRDQEMMLKTLELDLRNLKLQVAEFSKSDTNDLSQTNDETLRNEQERQDVLMHLDQLIEQVNYFGQASSSE